MKKYEVFGKSPTFIAEVQRKLYATSYDTISAYENETKAFTEMYKRYRKGVKAVETRQSFQRKIDGVAMGTPKERSFFLARPKRDEILDLLRQEAQAVLHGQNPTQKEITKYVQEHFDEVEHDRLEKWNEARSVFYNLEQTRIEREKLQYQREFEQKRQALNDVLNGEPYVVEQGMQEISATIDVPFHFDYEYTYNQPRGLVEVDVELVNDINIPLQKAVTLASGKVSIKNKLVREMAEEKKDTILSFVYYFASKIFEISLHITNVEMTVWSAGKLKGYIWVNIPRDGIMRDVPRYIVPAADIEHYRKVADIRVKSASVEIAAIPADKFQKLIALEKAKPSVSLRPATNVTQTDVDMAYISLQDAENLLRKLRTDDELSAAINEAKAKCKTIVAVDRKYKQMIADAAVAAMYGREDEYNQEMFGIKPTSYSDRDPLFEDVARWIVQSDLASTSALQRRYQIGYNRAGRIMDQMEAAGIVGPALGGSPRKVLLTPLDIDMLFK